MVLNRCDQGVSHAAATAVAVFADVGRFLTLCARSRSALAAENLFLRKQLALYEERKMRPHLATDAVRFVMGAPGRLFEWRSALGVVKPDTLPAGIGKNFACSGGGSPGRKAGPRCRATFASHPPDGCREQDLG